MGSNFTLGLAAIALGLGIAGTSAATIAPSTLTTDDAAQSSMQPPGGNFSSGLSAIKAHRANGLVDDSLVGVLRDRQRHLRQLRATRGRG